LLEVAVVAETEVVEEEQVAIEPTQDSLCPREPLIL
jgi:hypothetical protein